jgi:lysine-N-methylase
MASANPAVLDEAARLQLKANSLLPNVCSANSKAGVLMGKYSPVAIAPKYMETFRCIGSECEENCCHGWHVTIDKQTFKQYRTVQIHGLSDKLKSTVVKTEAPSGSGDYAHIKLDENGACPFLDEKSLCEIQGKLGSDYLSNTCKTYPRSFIRKDDELYLYATLSCPEAARKSLLSPDAMDMVMMTLPFANDSALPLVKTIRTNTDNPDLLQELSRYIFETSFHIIRSPENRPWEALTILGLMVRRMTRYLAGQECDDPRQAMVDAMINFTNPEYLRDARKLVQGIAIERNHQIRLLRGVLHVYFASYSGRSSYRQTIADTMDGIQFDENDLKGSEARYNEAEQRWFSPFDDAHPHILKNYLLNDIGKNSFPIGNRGGLEKEFLLLAIRFSMIKMMLIGIAGLKKENFGEADYIRVIYTFSRNIEHNVKFTKDLLDLLEQDGLSNVATAALLMR